MIAIMNENMSNTKGFRGSICQLFVYRFDWLGLIAIENKAVAFELLTVGSIKEPAIETTNLWILPPQRKKGEFMGLLKPTHPLGMK